MGDALARDTNTRRYGLDILRIVSIALVVMLHVLGHGGIIKGAQGAGPIATGWMLEAFAFCAVDCFVLITGYFMCTKSFKSRRVISLWIQVFFYSVVIAVVMAVVEPSLSVKSLFPAALFPVMSNQWWFFTQYFGLLFLMPLLNGATRAVRDNGHAKLVFVTIVIVFCIVPFIAHEDIFKLVKGYSVVWFVLLYLMGGCMHFMRPKAANSKLVYLVAYAIAAIALCASYLLIDFGKLPLFDSWKTVLYSYASPFVLFESLALFRFFEGLNVKNAAAKRIISWVAPAVFAVYLISDHKLVRDHFISGAFKPLGTAAPWEIVCCVVGSVIAITLVCIVIERVRLFLFKVLRIDDGLKALGEKADAIVASRFTEHS